MRKAAVLFIVAVVLSGCGYHMAGVGSEKNNFYIESMRNVSADLTVSKTMEQNITRFFLNYGMLTSRDSADYILRITLIEKSVSASILSSTREALSSMMGVGYEIVAEDRSGAVIYERSIRRTQTFTTGRDIKSYSNNEKKTFDDLTAAIFTEFRYDFTTP